MLLMKTTFFHQEGSGAGAKPEASLHGLHSLGVSAQKTSETELSTSMYIVTTVNPILAV